MESKTSPQINFNADVDYERAVDVLKRNAGRVYRDYQEAKADPARSPEAVNQLLVLYGQAVEATKTLRPEDTDNIQSILTSAA